MDEEFKAGLMEWYIKWGDREVSIVDIREACNKTFVDPATPIGKLFHSTYVTGIDANPMLWKLRVKYIEIIKNE